MNFIMHIAHEHDSVFAGFQQRIAKEFHGELWKKSQNPFLQRILQQDQKKVVTI